MGEGEGGGAEDMSLSQRGALYYADDITIILLCKRRRKTPCNPDSMIQIETNKQKKTPTQNAKNRGKENMHDMYLSSSTHHRLLQQLRRRIPQVSVDL
jgi:hypothetical protein